MCHLPLEAIGNQRRVHGRWAQSGHQKRYPSPISISNETNDRHCPPFRNSLAGRVHLLGEDPQCCAPPEIDPYLTVMMMRSART